MAHILGRKSPQEELLIKTRMWAREPGTRPILQFIHDYKNSLDKSNDPYTGEDIALNWTAGFVAGMSLVGGVFLGDFSVSLARAVLNVMEDEIKDEDSESEIEPRD
jgi:hypothetical protein